MSPKSEKAKPADGLVAALIAAKAEFPPILKTAKNPFFKSNYADLAAVISACDEKLGEHGLVITQTTMAEPLCLVTTLRHVSGNTIEGMLPLEPAKPRDPQSMGSAITYARRYAYMAILGIAAEDDDGNAASRKPKPKPAQEEMLGDERNRIRQYMLDDQFLGWAKPHAKNWLKKHFQCETVTELDNEQVPDALRLIEQAYADALREQAEKDAEEKAGAAKNAGQ